MGYRKGKAKAKSMPKATRGVVRQVERRRQDVDEVGLALEEMEELQKEQEEEGRLFCEEMDRIYGCPSFDEEDDEEETFLESSSEKTDREKMGEYLWQLSIEDGERLMDYNPYDLSDNEYNPLDEGGEW